MNTLPHTTDARVRKYISELMAEWKEWCIDQAVSMSEEMGPLMDQPAGYLTWTEARDLARLLFLQKVGTEGFLVSEDDWSSACNLFMRWLNTERPDHSDYVLNWTPVPTPATLETCSNCTSWKDLHLVVAGLKDMQKASFNGVGQRK